MRGSDIWFEKCNGCQNERLNHGHFVLSAQGKIAKSPSVRATDWAFQIVRYMLSPGSLVARGVISFDLVDSLTIEPTQARTLRIAVEGCHLPAFFGSFNEASFFRTFGEALKTPASPLSPGYPHVVR